MPSPCSLRNPYPCGGATVGIGSLTRRITIHAYSAADNGANAAIVHNNTVRSSSSPDRGITWHVITVSTPKICTSVLSFPSLLGRKSRRVIGRKQ